MSDARRLEPIRILDWYDGIVLAIVRTNWRSEVFLASLLSWDRELGMRTLALVPLDEEQVARLQSLTDWRDIRTYLDALRDGLTIDMTVIRLNDVEGVIVGEASASARDAGRDLFGDAEGALGPERRRWMA